MAATVAQKTQPHDVIVLKSTMLACRAPDRRYVVRARQGAQPEFDVSAGAKELAQLQAGTARLYVLFDWTTVESWPFKSPSIVGASRLEQYHASDPASGYRSHSKTLPTSRIDFRDIEGVNAEARSFHRRTAIRR
jgi:hypothetical protein